MTCLGLDIGGANLKISDGERSITQPFPLWKSPERLPEALSRLLSRFSEQAPLAVTMTGELADCYERRDLGVQAILNALEQAAPLRKTGIWCTAGEFLAIEQAREFTELVAAANWHALATWAGRMAPTEASLLIDIGSTTTDVIPIEEGLPMPAGRTDLERLLSGELVYLGVSRTPLCSLVSEVPLRGSPVPLAREVFSTSLDVALLLEKRQEDAENRDTANGRPATRREAATRLARQLCCDAIPSMDQQSSAHDIGLSEWSKNHLPTSLSISELMSIADHVHGVQLELVGGSVRRVTTRMSAPPKVILLCGAGEDLARECLERHCPELAMAERISLTGLLGEAHSHAACAYALSRLGRERNG